MNCQQCGTPIPDGTKFCPACGAPQTAPQPQEAPQEAAPAFCASCGNPLPAGATFCAACGQPAGSAAPRKPKLNKKLFIGIGAAVAVIALVVVLIVVLAGGSSNSPEGVAKKFAEATSKMDYEAILECYPDAYLRQITESEEGTSRSSMIKKALEEAEKGSGGFDLSGMMKDLDIDIDVKEVVTDKDDEKLEAFINDVENGAYSFTEDELDSIEDYALVEMEVTADVPFFGKQTDTQSVCCIKMNGTWYLLGESNSFDDDEFTIETDDFSMDTDGFSFDF